MNWAEITPTFPTHSDIYANSQCLRLRVCKLVQLRFLILNLILPEKNVAVFKSSFSTQQRGELMISMT